jgi:hypothetical protein
LVDPGTKTFSVTLVFGDVAKQLQHCLAKDVIYVSGTKAVNERSEVSGNEVIQVGPGLVIAGTQ